MKTHYFFLHGFLGQGSDWKTIKDALKKQSSLAEFHTPSLFSPNNQSDIKDFYPWANDFNKSVRKKCKATHKKILIGYSMGGRLALHALKQDHELWDQTFILSTHPGIASHLGKARRERWLWESSWSQKFLNKPWEMLISEWDQNEVLSNSQRVPREEKSFSRSRLAQALTHWSPTKHEKDLLKPTRLIGLIGGKDKKYLNIYQFLKEQNQFTTFEIIPDAGHRIIFDKAHIVAQKIISLSRCTAQVF